jgi:hypothetical protein
MIIADDMSSRGVAKVATDPAGLDALRREAEAIATLGSALDPPLAAPRILHEEPGLLLLEPIPWRPRARPWRLEPEVARALGALFRRGGTPHPEGRGAAHGDCAPWNLLRKDGGWVLLDWESARRDAAPFEDLCHYLIQGHALLGRPSWTEIRVGFLDGGGWVGSAIEAYADAAGVRADDAPTFLESYLRTSQMTTQADGRHTAAVVRSRLLRQLVG